MPTDSADMIDPHFDEDPQPSAARSGQHRRRSSRAAPAANSDATSEHARSVEDPAWDDESELTQAFEYERLAPWYVPPEHESVAPDESEPNWEMTLTERLESIDSGASSDGRQSRANSPGSSATPSTQQRQTAARATTYERTGAVDRANWSNELLSAAEPTRPGRASSGVQAFSRTTHGLIPSAPPARSAHESQAVRKSQSAARPARMPAQSTQPRARQPTVAVPYSSPAALAPVSYAQASAGAVHAGEFHPPASTSSCLWMAAGGLLALVTALGFRLWTDASTDLASETVVASTVPVVLREETGFSVTSRPAGAQVQVDGKSTGLITPARIRHLTPGLHSVALKLPGYFDTSLPAVLEDGTTTELPQVELRSLPAAAALPSVTREPAPSVRQSRAVRSSQSRRAAYRARRRARASHRAAIESVAVRGIAEPHTAVAAPTGEGVLQINSRPWSRVLVNDRFVGNTPQRDLRLQAGTHVVRLVNKSLNMSKTFTIVIRDGETITKVEALNDASAQSRVATANESAVAQVVRTQLDP